jgi:hypothetical protein
MPLNRVAAVLLGVVGAAGAVPIPLAQLDFAGLINVFDIDSGDTPGALLAIAGVAGFLTIGVLAVAFVGAGLALAGASSARVVLFAAALAGLVTAMPLWVPTAIVIGAAAFVAGLGDEQPSPEAA